MAETLLLKTAKAMYRTDPAVRRRVDFGSLSQAEKHRYEVMATAALATAFGEPVSDDEAELAPLG